MFKLCRIHKVCIALRQGLVGECLCLFKNCFLTFIKALLKAVAKSCDDDMVEDNLGSVFLGIGKGCWRC